MLELQNLQERFKCCYYSLLCCFKDRSITYLTSMDDLLFLFINSLNIYNTYIYIGFYNYQH